MINPYNSINWDDYNQIIGTTHDHVKRQSQLKNLWNGGVRFFTISNYYRSEPLVFGYNSNDKTTNYIFFPDYPNNSLPEIVYWPDPNYNPGPNYDQEPDEISKKSCIFSPNAEHHNLIIGALHMNSIGSWFSSGTHDNPNNPGKHIRPIGYGNDYKHLIDDVVKQLKYLDGGGLTINHPVWTYNSNNSFSVNIINDILDSSPYVLGQEVIESFRDAREWWDNVLITGRRSWGFFTPDHQNAGSRSTEWWGRNILLIPKNTSYQNLEYEGLKAYRNGTFYGRRDWSDLSFKNIDVNNYTITAQVYFANGAPYTHDGFIGEDKITKITFIEDGIRHEITLNNGLNKDNNTNIYTASYDCSPLCTYVRIEAECNRVTTKIDEYNKTTQYPNGTPIETINIEDIIFSQPIIYKPYVPRPNNKKFFFKKAALWIS